MTARMEADVYIHENTDLGPDWRAKRVPSAMKDFVSVRLGPIHFLLDPGQETRFAEMLERVAREARKALL